MASAACLVPGPTVRSELVVTRHDYSVEIVREDARFQALQAEGIAILFIEQNVRLALSMAGRGYILESGRLAIAGEATTLINSPEVRRIFLGG